MSDEWKEISAVWAGEGGAFIGRNAGGGEVQMGTIAGHPGVSPMELVLVAVAGCTGVDVVNILEKKRQRPERFELGVRAKRADIHPKVYTEIEVTYHLWGGHLQIKDIEQAIQLSEEKYCSVSAMLRGSARITTRYVYHTPEGLEITPEM